MRADIPSISFRPANENLQLEIVKVEELFSRELDSLNHDPQQPHRPSFNIILLPMEGKGKHMLDFQEYFLEAGDILMIAKGQVHAFGKNPQYKGYLLLFTEDFVLHYFPEESLKLLSRLYNYHIGSPLLKDQGFVQALIDEIAKELMEKNKNWQDPNFKLEFSEIELSRNIATRVARKIPQINMAAFFQEPNKNFLKKKEMKKIK